MAGRIEVDVIPFARGYRAEGPSRRVGDIEVVDHHVEVELLRRGRVRPARCDVVRRRLERETGGRVVRDSRVSDTTPCCAEDRPRPKVKKPPQVVGLDRDESVYEWTRCPEPIS